MSNDTLKLVRTNLNYHVLGFITAIIICQIFQMIILFYAPLTSDESHAWFHLYGLSRPSMSAWKAEKFKYIKNACPQWDSKPFDKRTDVKTH